MASLLPPNWRAVTLKEVAANKQNAIVDGPFGSNLKTDDYVESGVPVLQGKNITNDAFKWFDVRYITEKKAHELKRSSVRVNDLLVVKIGSIGYSAVVDTLNGYEFAIIPANLVKVTPNSEVISTKYLHRWLTSPDAKRYLVANASKTAQPALSLGKIKELPVPLPPLPEQVRIAAILDQAAALRAKRREALKLLDNLRQSIFVEMFGEPLSKAEGRNHVPFEAITSRITYGFTSPMKHLDSGIPILTAKNVRNGYIDLENVHYADQAEFDALTSKSKPERGDILITKDGTIGRCAVVETDTTLCINQSVALVQILQDKVLPNYVVAYLTSNRLQLVMNSMSKGNALAHLQITELAKLPIPLPPMHLQVEFLDRIRCIEKVVIAQNESLNQLDSLFATLQHLAFRGELV